MRAEQSRLHTSVPGQEEEEYEEEEEEEEDAGRTVGSGKSGRGADVSEAKPAQRTSGTPAVELSSVNLGPFCSVPRPLPPLPGLDGWDSHGPPPAHELRLSPPAGVPSSARDTFNSSFSFIQQSLNSCRTAETPPSPEPEPLNQLNKATNSPQSKRPVQLLSSTEPADSEDLPPGRRFWQRCPWDVREVPPEPDGDCVDIEITSSLSVDSDNASASSVTSGYDSATPASEQGWDSLVKKYEVVLQDCLQNNRTYTKVGTDGGLDSKEHQEI